MHLKILLTGADSLLGHALAIRLLEAGHQVFAFVSTGREIAHLQLLHLPVLWGDSGSAKDLTGAMDGMDAVFALHDYDALYPKARFPFFHQGKDTTEALLKACHQTRVDRLIYASSVFALPPAKGQGAQNMPHLKGPLLTIAAGTARVRRAASNIDPIDVSILYLPHLLAPNLDNLALGEYLFDTPAFSAFTKDRYRLADGRDVAMVMERLLRHPPHTRYLIPGQLFSTQEFLKELQKVTSIPLPTAQVAPGKAWRSVLYHRAIPGKPAFTLRPFFPYGTSRDLIDPHVEDELGYSSRPLVETLQDTWGWYRFFSAKDKQ